MRIWTRLTGWATLLVGYATVLVAVVPYRELPPKRQQLWLLGATAACALCWILASALVRAHRRTALRKKTWRRRHEPWPEARSSHLLCWVLGFGIALTSAAALCQGVGPDGGDGAWQARVQQAGGMAYDLPVQRVVGRPHPADPEAGRTDEYESTVVVRVPFTSGARQVTLDGVRTHGQPEAGATLRLRYAPKQPGLGVRQVPENDIGSFAGRVIALPAIWIVALAAGLVTAIALHRREAGVRRSRRFEPWVHLPAAAVLACGAALIVPLLIGFPATDTGWALACAAAATPWLALTWVAKTS